MIIPSIDLMNGQTVQLVGGRDHVLSAGDPMPIAERFAVAGTIAVVDLDAALGQGGNPRLVETLCRQFPCRFGGGIRDLDVARRWLDRGARQIVVGTAATADLLAQLPKERVIAALDAAHGEVVVEGWRTGTGKGVVERMAELRDVVGGFLVTIVEREGRLAGIDLEQAAALREAAGEAALTLAGGITTAADVAALDRLGIDAQVGMALYTGKLELADAIAAPLRSDRPDELVSTVVVDRHGRALGQCYSNRESLREAVRRRRGVYWSRKRGLWVKGATSGATQRLLRIDADCDRDALRFTVAQAGAGFCHDGTESCWGDLQGLPAIAARIARRVGEAPAASYTRRLLAEPDLLAAKLAEEADELAAAGTSAEVTWEAADVLYFTMVAMARAGVSLAAVEAELDRRALAVTRRDGGATS